MSRALSSPTVLRSGISGAKVRSCWYGGWLIKYSRRELLLPVPHCGAPLCFLAAPGPKPIFPSVIAQLQDAADED